MQTFLPFESYAQSASVLDNRRLGKQRVETMQIMLALVEGKGWVNHPATKMWKGFEFSLLYYQFAMCWEWHFVRGFADSCLQKTGHIFWDSPQYSSYVGDDEVAIKPWWIGIPEFHLSHRSNLVRKDPEHYGKIFPRVPNDLEYYWPE